MTFLIVRPREKAESTLHAFVLEGLPAKALPIMDIEISSNSALRTRFNKANPVCIVITSTYAVKWLIEALRINQILINFATMNFVCVGSASAELLKEYKGESIIHIACPENSEGILQAPCLQMVKNSDIVLLKGEGGRDLIERSLTEKHANISVLNVYKRVTNDASISGFTFEPSQIRCIISTSVEITALLLKNVDNHLLLSCTWIVASERIKEYAKKHGIKRIIVSQGASNTALLACANRIVKTGVVHD